MTTRTLTHDLYWEHRGAAVWDVLGIAGLVALGALVKIPLPFTPVPLTLQTFVVLAAGYLVGPRRATAGIALYLALGLAGMPLFAVTSGATAGYLLAFLAAPFVVTRFRNPAAGVAAGTAIIYLLGAGWLVLALGLSPWQALVTGVVPFLPGDALKAVAVYRVARWREA